MESTENVALNEDYARAIKRVANDIWKRAGGHIGPYQIPIPPTRQKVIGIPELLTVSTAINQSFQVR